jgi:hypothetical protein
MRILLDECVPWPLAGLLVGHESSSVQVQGWTGTENAELLRRAAGEFELLITIERGVDEQNVANPPLAILELSTNDLRRIRISAPAIALAARTIQPREYVKLMVN